MNTNITKLFNTNNELIDTFDAEVENVLKSIHGDNYYDIDEEFIIKETSINKEINEDKKINKKVSIKDFIPLLFFVIIFVIIVIAGYYFLNNFDLTSIL